jgi:hypothetical protein
MNISNNYRMLNELKIKYCNVTYTSILFVVGSVVGSVVGCVVVFVPPIGSSVFLVVFGLIVVILQW